MFSKMSLITAFILGVYFSISSNGVSAIMCYNCISFPNNTACADPMGSNVSMVTCPDNYYCTKVKYNTQGYGVTSRSCDLASNLTCQNINSTLSQNYADLSGFSCWTCNTDHCNSAATFGIPVLAMIVALLAVRLA